MIKDIIKGVIVFGGFIIIIGKFLTTTTPLHFLGILILWTIFAVIFSVEL